jgi:hypothetical protein
MAKFFLNLLLAFLIGLLFFFFGWGFFRGFGITVVTLALGWLIHKLTDKKAPV